MEPVLGTYCLTLVVPCAVYALAALYAGSRWVRPNLLASGRAALQVVCALYGVAGTLLVAAFLRDDFRIEYVAEHSQSAMDVLYKLAGLWAGLDGSLLFWALLLSGMTWIAVRQLERTTPRLMPIAAAVLVALLGFFGVVLVFAANPFTTTLVVPFDGNGLNPLLQAPEMAIHPPSLYIGYVSAAIPFAMMVAALLQRSTDLRWLDVARRWILLCWCFLSIGNLLGMHWAYLELGWGGFWAWDPVENAAAMPWFTATALLHSLMTTQARRGLAVWTYTLMALTFVLTMLGTYLTRSGVVQSVHAFSNSTVGAYFAAVLIAATVGSAVLLLWHARHAPRQPVGTLASREGSFLLSNMILTAAALAILCGTMLPTVSEALGGARLTVGPDFFNRMMAPFGVVLLGMLGFAPVLPWGPVAWRTLWNLIRRPLALAVSAVAAAWWLGWHHWVVLTIGGLALVTGFTSLRQLGRLLRQAPATRTVSAQSTLQRRIGAYVAHTAIVLILLGCAGAALHTEVDLEAREGDHFALGPMDVEFAGLRYRKTPVFEAIGAELIVRRGETVVTTLYPARQFYPGSDQPTTEIGRYATWGYDLYTVLGGFDVDAHTAQFKVMHNPLVRWIWIGGLLLVCGAVLVMTAGDARQTMDEV